MLMASWLGSIAGQQVIDVCTRAAWGISIAADTSCIAIGGGGGASFGSNSQIA